MFYQHLKDHWLTFRVMGLSPTFAGLVGTAIGILGPAIATIYYEVYQFFSCLFPLNGVTSDTVCTLFGLTVNATHTH